ncbi:hypothetical protein J31TS4_15070 [Paenibacillus sp. J31TS4]|uniref:response regulator n=1 Tax=Paenibacillus sp. J31TS4 TaxID=2807195 RepID=UPI001B2A8F17|nr:response regulator [Paenibacillus sp. J31TS4]GIP38227.1 hypothetical protein J31TS4_15070 [Paenibacillus sp. J31TS4]
MKLKTKLGIGYSVLLGSTGALTILGAATAPGGWALGAAAVGLAAMGAGVWTAASIGQRINRGMNQIAYILKEMASGKLDESLEKAAGKDEFGDLAGMFRELAVDLLDKTAEEREVRLSMEQQAWIKSHISELMTRVQGFKSVKEVAQLVMNELTPLVGAAYGTFYMKESEGLRFAAGYAVEELEEPAAAIRPGIGLVGQCALDRSPIVIEEVPADYFRVRSSLGGAAPAQLLVQPIPYRSEVLAVLELASLRKLTETERQLLDQLCGSLGTLLNTIRDRDQVESLLVETRKQKEELQQQTQELQTQNEELQMQSEELVNQQEALKLSNEGLEKQTRALRISEERLQRQQEELEESNQQLLDKARELETQYVLTAEQKKDLERQAGELSLASKYKSEFLANMSHELRTPLNSLLILSQLLQENKEANLLPKQVEYARTIHSSGSELLHRINEILDMSKIESGKMTLVVEPVSLQGIKETMERSFQPLAAEKGIEFAVEISDRLPSSLQTDSYRLQQILRNLVANALKFTEQGSVHLRIDWAPPASVRESDGTGFPAERIAFTVVDTGIGIPQDKLAAIFEAFQQADGTTSRKYGGTGLGLTISRELAKLIGGDIGLQSAEGKGSTFTLYLPVAPAREDQTEAAASREDKSARPENVLLPLPAEPNPDLSAPPELTDDRDVIGQDDRVLLVIEDDLEFAKLLLEMARERGFRTLAAVQGDKGLALAQKYQPDAIILDLHLPVMDGWSVLNRLKNDPDTRHIPIHIISGMDEQRQGLSLGAIAYIRKPVDKDKLEQSFLRIESFLRKEVKRLLIVEDDEALRGSLVDLIDYEDVAITAVGTGEGALEALGAQHFDCMVLDLGLADITGFDLLERIRTNPQLRTIPIIIYTGKQITSQEETQLKQYADSIIIKNVKSQERLYDETSLFLHRIHAGLPEDKQKLLENLSNREKVLEGRKILLVDDDIRNIFALSGLLEGYRMAVSFAQNGREALQVLEQQPDIDLVLMDIMMPEMNGYEAMKKIRKQPAYDQLPIIALTAKAMEEDRFKCLEAGASDYISKPINPDQLFSLLKVWLYK